MYEALHICTFTGLISSDESDVHLEGDTLATRPVTWTTDDVSKN